MSHIAETSSRNHVGSAFLCVVSYENDPYCFTVTESTTLMELQGFIQERWPPVVSNKFHLRYEAPEQKTYIAIVDDSDVKHMMLMHAALEKNIILMFAENEDTLKSKYSGCDAIENEEIDGGQNSLESWSRAIVGEGQTFQDKKHFRATLRKYAIATRRTFKFKLNAKTRVSAICRDVSCNWRIYVSFNKSDDVFAIRKCNLTHTCDAIKLGTRDHPNASRAWVADVVEGKLRVEPRYRVRDMKTDILREFGVELSYQKAWEGKERAVDQIHGSKRYSYERLRRYTYALVRRNPGSIAECEVYTDTSQFRRLFICFYACMSGFVLGCRPVLFLDGTQIKSKFRGTLLSAVSKDANDGVFTVAYAVVDSENDDNWDWFCQKLSSILCVSGRNNWTEYTFFSDRHDGLLKAIPKWFSGSNHSYCLRHLVDNFRKQVLSHNPNENKKAWTNIFNKAAYAPTEAEFIEHIGRIVARFKDSGALEFIQKSNPNCWANSLFPGNRWGIVNNNMAESWNNWVNDARAMPLVSLVDKIRKQVMVMMNFRREEGQRYFGKLCPRPERRLKKNLKFSRTMRVDRATGYIFEVTDNEQGHLVDLQNKTCSCKWFQLERIPCKHACACIESSGLSIYDFCDTYYRSDSFREAYRAFINPIPTTDLEEALIEEDVLEPHVKRPPGRRRTKRIPSQVETRALRCRNCRRFGHNRRTCKDPIKK